MRGGGEPGPVAEVSVCGGESLGQLHECVCGGEPGPVSEVSVCAGESLGQLQR